MDEKSKKRRRAKRQQWLRAFAREFGLDLKQHLLGFAITVVVTPALAMWVLLEWGMGWGELADQAFVQSAGLVAAAIVLGVSAFFGLVTNAFRASARVAEEGGWFGDQFVYRTPKVVGLYRLEADQAPFSAEVYLADVPAGALVRCYATLSPDNEYWNVTAHPKGWTIDLGAVRIGRFGGAMLSADRKLTVAADVRREDAAPVVVRVLLDSWESQ